MATSRQHLCDICFIQHITEDALVWCPECEENFCDKCKIHHDIAKATRKHEIISIENVLKLPRFVQKIKINCTDHDERFVYFCSEHETPCCVKCIKTKHIKCRNLTPIETVVKDIKQSPSFSDLEMTLSDLLTNISNFVEDREANRRQLKEQKLQCEEEIRSARKAINTYFDELEADLTNKVQQAFVKQESQIQTALGDIELHMAKVKEVQENLNCIKSIASDFQSFMAMRMMSQTAQIEEIEQQNWIKSDKFNWNDISIIPCDIKSSRDGPPSVGKIQIQENCCKVTLKMRKSREAQLMGPIGISRNIETIQLKVKLECKICSEYEKQHIMDGGVLPNGELIFCDKRNSLLVILDSEGIAVRNLILTFIPIRFAIIEKNSIAITTTDKVNIVDLKTGQVLKTFAEGVKARSILLHNRNFIIENLGKGFIVADFQGNTVKSMPINFSEFLYHQPTIIKDKLYYAEQDGSEVVCLDLDSNKLWKIRDERLVSPYGMTSDDSNLLFVCGIKSNNIFVISADGKTFKEIVAPNEHLNGVISAYFNKIKQELLTVTQNGNVAVYDVI